MFSESLESTLSRWGDTLLRTLLSDFTTRKPIRWASEGVSDLGAGFGRWDTLTPARVRKALKRGFLRPRAAKRAEERLARVRVYGEVFTPAGVCKRMTDVADESWLLRATASEETPPSDLFLCLPVAPTPLRFCAGRAWQDYVRRRCLEIACGEAPFLTARYDVATGETLPWALRYGLLDRKLRALPICLNRQAWHLWARRAYAATYGYEYQGDNLFLARCNLLLTFEEAHRMRWREGPSREALQAIAETIARNLWQMDGLTGATPGETPADEGDFFSERATAASIAPEARPCRLCVEGRICALSEVKGAKAMKFDFIIGNPPYQEESIGKQKTFAPPVYHRFLEGAYALADRVEMIHPARFLFNAGSTPKAWNRKMLDDPHLKVVAYEADGARFFPGTDIKGGVAITYRDAKRTFGAIGTFTPHYVLNDIKSKVCNSSTGGGTAMAFAEGNRLHGVCLSFHRRAV